MRKIFFLLLLIVSALSINSQTFVDAGPNLTSSCSSSIQLNAIPKNGWAEKILPYTYGLNSIFFTTPDSGFVVTTNGYVLRTTDGGRSWSSMLINPFKYLYNIYFKNSRVGFIIGDSNFIWRTDNGGETWNNDTYISGNLQNQLRSIHFSNDSTGYIVGLNGQFITTTDGGLTWPSNKSLINKTLFSVFFKDSNCGYVAGLAGVILKTTDAGQTWTQMNNALPYTLSSIHFPTNTLGFAVGGGGAILRTIDNISWQAYVTDSIYQRDESGEIKRINGKALNKMYFTSVHFTSPTTGYICGVYGTGAIFLKTLDGGNAWFEMPNNMGSKVTNMYFSSDNIGYACGTGRIAKYKEGPIQECTYKWSPTSGLNNPNIQNPIATPNKTTLYTVTAFQGKDTLTDTVRVNIVPISIIKGASKTIVCDGSVQLDSVITNYKGLQKLHYKWTPAAGLSSDTIPNPYVTVKNNTVYTVTVTTPSGCTASDQVTVNYVPLAVTASVDKTVVCKGSTKLMATTNYKGGSPLHYKWTPASGLSCDTIPDPIATIANSTLYSVTVTTPSGCTATNSVTANVTTFTANAGVDKTIQCGAMVQLDSVITNFNDSGKLKYKWTPSTGLSNDTIPNPRTRLLNTTTYTVTVTTPLGCTASDQVVVNVNPITVNIGADISTYCGAPIQLGVVSTNYLGSGLKYKWSPSIGLSNDSIPNPIAVASTRSYQLTVTSPSGCTASDNVSIITSPLDKPLLSYVGINGKNKNILVWKKPTIGKIDQFFIYKETNVTNSYAKIGAVPYDSAAVFVDENSNPDVQSNRYKISLLDGCGSETVYSDYHKTMHLSINKGINTIWNLIWEAYEGFPVSTYNIYRGTTPSNIQIIGSLSGSNTQFSDYTAPTGYVYYQIEAVSSGLASVPVLAPVLRSASLSSYSSRSNVATNNSGANAIDEQKDNSNGVKIYPNPVANRFELIVPPIFADGARMKIFDLRGRVVYEQFLYESKTAIDVSSLSSGVYILSVSSENVVSTQRLVIQQ